MPDGKKARLQKGWNFLGPDPKTVPDVGKAFAYCATDGRPHTINTMKNGKTLEARCRKDSPEADAPDVLDRRNSNRHFPGDHERSD